MTNLSDFSNGASLEDCRTNFFALSDLNGIKWKRLSGADSTLLDPVEDPVLLAYCECISSGILAAWRRVSNEARSYAAGETSCLSCFKELWIFWCGDDPDFSKLLTAKLCETEVGSWESGLSYEGRTLFFKALHNAIERELLSHGYARFGKYFIEPQILDVNVLNSQKQKAIAFNFFIHGESTVCASIDIRLVSRVYILDKIHVAAAQAGHPSVKVILCPYGMSGTLTGTGYKYNDPQMARFLNQWNNFFPHHWKRDQWKLNSDCPHVVEVIVAGARMKYPISYVFVTEEDHLEIFPHLSTPRPVLYNIKPSLSMSNSLVTAGLLTPPLSPNNDVGYQKRNFKNLHHEIPHFTEEDPRECVQIIGHVNNLKRSICQDCFSYVTPEKSEENPLWSFHDPSQVSKCTCSRSSKKAKKKHSASTLPNNNSQKSSKNQKSVITHAKIPFHRQAPSHAIHELSQPKESKSEPKGDAILAKTCLSSSIPQLLTSVSQQKQESLSSYPSDTFYTPATLDPVMPTLSPQPPLPSIKEEVQSPDSSMNVSSSSSADSLQGVTLKGRISEEILSPLHTSLLNMFENAKNLSKLSNPVKIEPPCSDETNPIPSQTVFSVEVSDSLSQVIEKPSLPKRQFDDPEGAPLTMSGLLYDYNHMSDQFWAPPKHTVAAAQNPYDSPDEDAEPESTVSIDAKVETPKPVPSAPKDPYEFTDADDTAPSEKGFRPSIESFAREEEKYGSFSLLSPIDNSPPHSKPLIPKFIREEDLAVSFNDLENIFDTSSDEETVDSDLTNAKAPAYDEFAGKIELSRIYPTPPSWEQIAVPSPLGNNIHGSDSAMPDNEALKEHIECDNYELVFEDEDINIFIPPLIHVFPETPEYSSLELPPASEQSPELTYKPSFTQAYSKVNYVSSFEDPALLKTSSMPGPGMLSSDQNTPFLSLNSSQNYFIPQPVSEPFSSGFSLPSQPSSTASPQPHPEIDPLVTNLMLSDSLLNVFKDINFSGCSICVCNLNIKGSDVGVLLPSSLTPCGNNEPQYKCTCGFSALVHRHNSYRAGLFYEDEVDIFGTDCDTIEKIISPSDSTSAEEKSKVMPYLSKQIPEFFMDILRAQCKSVTSSFSLFHKTHDFRERRHPSLNNLDFMDSCEVCFLAMEEGRRAAQSVQGCLDRTLKPSCLHKWPFLSSPLPSNSLDSMLILDSLKPLLQVAIHKKKIQKLWEVTYVVSGPLTWKEFHRLSPRGNEDQCEPQPIPFLCAGTDGDHALFSPFAIRHWDKLNLEPYSLRRDVAYVVVAPENDSILPQIKSFFKDLSCCYEHHNLGKHRPITKVLRDGIMRVGKTAASKLAEEPVDEWFNSIGDGSIPDKLRLYARVCKHRLAPHLSTLPLDKAIFESSTPARLSDKYEFSSQSSDSKESCNIPKDNNADNHQLSISGTCFESYDEDEPQPPELVIYIVEPFTFGQLDENTYRLVALGLLHSYADMLSSLPEATKNIINLQIISLDSILNSPGQKEKRFSELKSLAFSVFSQSHRMFSFASSAKSLTGFGPAAAQDLFFANNKNKISAPLKIYSQPYLVQFRKDKQTILGEMFGDDRDKSGTLHCCYCLSKNKRFIVASCINEKGEFCETNVINVDIPVRLKRKNKSVLRFGLCKLLEFLFEIISVSVRPWRLIIERFGRLGQGELKTWAGLLSRKSLNSYSKRLRDVCRQCSISGVQDVPCILSVCLVSVEPDSTLRVLPDLFSPDRFSVGRYKSRTLNSPDDASCTHILVFPTSATTQSSQINMHQEHMDPLSGGLGDDFFDALNEDDISNAEINDIFKWTENSGSPSNSPRHESNSRSSSPNSAFKHSYPNEGTNQLASPFNFQDEPLLLLQQPLALGYYVSTAKSSGLPKWFWSSCPQLEDKCPVFLKSALLIHVPYVQKNSDDLFQSNSQQLTCHPMDSSYTTDVLRYVLESHNTLSWLSLDSNYQDRRSCLPLHMQTLIQLYDIVNVLL